MSNMASDAKACFSSKVEYRASVLVSEGKTGKETHGELADVYESSLHHLMLRLNSG